MNSPDEDRRKLLRGIPQVNELIESICSDESFGNVPRMVLLEATRRVLDEARGSILSPSGPLPEASTLEHSALAGKVAREAESVMKISLRKVVNATGVVLHTNIGRSPLSRSALDAVENACGGYCNLEYRTDEGVRGTRQEHLEPLLCTLTGAGGAMVVNNNAAAVLLVLRALARGREVIVSRGQLIEIGGSFRLPDIMHESGATLVEVGTTNRTRVEDYRNAIGPNTALIMKIHQSNFRIVGYSEDVSLRELVAVGKQQFIPVVEDLGSGSLVDLAPLGLTGEHTARQSLDGGADLVTFSGDKLPGGPQAGLIVGAREYVDAIRKHPLARALRVGKMTVAALEATLREYLDPEAALESVPALKMLSEPESSVRRRARRLKRRIDRSGTAGVTCRLTGEVSRAGGGSLPTAEIPTCCLAITHSKLSAPDLEKHLRGSDPAVLPRVKDNTVLLDLRTVSDDEVVILAGIIASIDG